MKRIDVGKEKPEMKHIQAFVDGHYTAEERAYILECCLGYNTTYAALFAMHFAFAKHMVQEAVYINGQFQSKFSKVRLDDEEQEMLRCCDILACFAEQTACNNPPPFLRL